MHPISEQQWLDLVAGELEEREAKRIRAHIQNCAECTEIYEELRAWHAAISDEAQALSRAVRTPDAEIDRLVESSLDNIRALGPAPMREDRCWTASEALVLLRSIMEPLCGAGTARAAIQLAIQRSTSTADREVNSGNWRLFVANLSEAVSSVCGLAAGRLVDRAGLCVAIEEGA